jgi:hypothetical protein
VIYATALASIGYGVGSAWDSVNKGLTVAGYVLFALIVVTIVGFVAYRLRQFRREDQLRRSGSVVPVPGVPGPGLPGPGVPGSGVSSSGVPGAGAGPADAGFTAGPADASPPERRAKPHSHRAS